MSATTPKVTARSILVPLGLSGLLASAACDKAAPLPSNTPAPHTETVQNPELGWPEEPFRAQRPQAKAVKDAPIPAVQTFELSNGLIVHLVEQRKLPTVSMTLEFDLGQGAGHPAKHGSVSVCMDLVDEGTRKLDKQAWTARQADHAVSVGSWSGEATSGFRVRALKSELGPALDMLKDLVMRPGLREGDLERLVQRAQAGVKQSKGNPAGIARRLFPKLVWGERHPYGHMPTEKSLGRIKQTDCKKMLDKLGPEGARLWVVGMVGRDELKTELERRLKWWKGDAPKRRRLPTSSPRAGTIVFVQSDDAVQSQVWIGHLGPSRDAADYESTHVMAQILGGSFSSRINMNLREDKGYSYGGRGRFYYHRGGSHFAASSSVEVSTTGPALREMRAEIEKMRTTEPSDAELKREIDGALMAVPGRFSNPSESMRTLQNLAYHGLPLDWHEGHQQRLRSVDAKSVRKAAADHLLETGFVVLVVGDGNAKSKNGEQSVLDDVRALAKEGLFGSGGLEIVDPDGKVVSSGSGK